MINKKTIKTHMPVLFNFVKSQPQLLKLAQRVNAKLQLREYKKLNTSNKSYSPKKTLNLLARAKAANLFDYTWYSKQQLRAFSCELEAFEDYLQKGSFSNINPSANFDTELYYKCNTDIYLSGEHALVHYLAHGKEEGRLALPARAKWHPKAIASRANGEPTSLKLAMCFHVFYGEFIDYYCKALAKFTQPVDVFVSVASDELAKKAIHDFKACSKVNKIVVKVVPNHGRNFGPMLVEFASDLQNYDLFCHMHSKKSLYSGRAQTQWADYLGEYLLNDPHVIKQVLNHFNDNPKSGLYYPTSFWMMPDWVNHWLKNKPAAQKFTKEWDIELKDDFLAYPAGGMFWARPEALKQLLNKEYKYDDFPGEPLPNDGSQLHALERMLGLLVEKNGYKQLFYYPKTGQFTHDTSYILAQYINTAEGLKNQLNNFEHISFDVFDTLVRREYHAPDYAKLLLGKALVESGVVSNAHEFVKSRNIAEFEVRKAKNFVGDVTIFETYSYLSEQLGWNSEQAHSYAEQEFAYDLHMILPKDEMVDIFNELILAGKQVTVASDTYYTKEQVALMLAKVGISVGFDLLVSSDLGKRKDSGTLWQHIKENLPEGQSFIHVGDNAVADAQIPGDFGLQNLHILNPLDKWQAGGFINPFVGEQSLNEAQILKWGPLVSDFGRFGFLGE
ncbi:MULTISPECIES: rhamnan synthesis F family protein [unclassified Pseudoalteromonas]|uniref:rhamnan synthesis F family protein n=1 Tax=unclassified Pseudoalteromonas TaxID=194690 RepID=UPI0004206116|nr:MULTISPECIES: rhamnan synthesis F family protein [unclassified Pseudoalteromonas]